MKEEMNELRQKYGQIATEIEDIAEQVSQMHYQNSVKIEFEPSEVLLPETGSDEKLEEENKIMVKTSEPEAVEDPKPGISNLPTEGTFNSRLKFKLFAACLIILCYVL